MLSQYLLDWQERQAFGEEVQPKEDRQTGKWVYDGFCVTTTQYKCNRCQTPSLDRSNFCPNCGADMKGGAK